jgi:hypothetical protein
MEINRAMMEMTTRSSISVNAFGLRVMSVLRYGVVCSHHVVGAGAMLRRMINGASIWRFSGRWPVRTHSSSISAAARPS